MNKDMRVLVLDDSKTMLRIISNTLKRLEIGNIDTAEDGLKGIELFDKNEYDIILSDINMPNMDGYEFLEYVRKRNSDVPIVMITTEGGKSSVIKALKMGANNYIIKPFTPQILKDKLATIIF